MFYQISAGHDLPHNPFNALVVPRPIGWISSVDTAGHVNLAPYSFFNAVAYDPPQVLFAATSNHAFGGLKDSVKNIQETGEFVVNLAVWELCKQMNQSAVAAPSEVDEFEYAGLSKAPAELVAPPRVKESPAHLECIYTQTVELPADPGNTNTVVFGQVIGIHIVDWALVDGKVDLKKIQPIGRLGYQDYVRVAEIFSMDRPTWSS